MVTISTLSDPIGWLIWLWALQIAGIFRLLRQVLDVFFCLFRRVALRFVIVPLHLWSLSSWRERRSLAFVVSIRVLRTTLMASLVTDDEDGESVLGETFDEDLAIVKLRSPSWVAPMSRWKLNDLLVYFSCSISSHLAYDTYQNRNSCNLYMAKARVVYHLIWILILILILRGKNKEMRAEDLCIGHICP